MQHAARPDGAVQARDVARSFDAEIHRVGDLEARVDALRRGVLPGLVDRVRREVDAEHWAANHPGLLEFDDRRLRFADNPRRSAALVGVVESCTCRCGHAAQSST